MEWKRISPRGAVRRIPRTASFLFSLLLSTLAGMNLSAQAGTPSGAYAGSTSCRACHDKFYKLWSASFHGLAMQPYTAELAAHSLTPQTEPIAVGEKRYRFVADAQGGRVVEQGPKGEARHSVTWVMGGKNVYYFLTPSAGGRLQTLPLAYDVRAKVWFDTAASGIRHFTEQHLSGNDQPVDWTDRLYTFNTSCYGCHVSQIATNYDLASDSYRTTWLEPGINCESCHGPSAEHNQALEGLPEGQKPPEVKIVTWKGARNPVKLNDMCATCHARLIPITNDFKVGDRFWDHYDLGVLGSPDFYPDGRDLGENYTFTGWLLSPCLKGGTIDCDICHTPSGRYRFKGKGNEVCSGCHADRVKNAPAHTHHKEGSPGNECLGCHMPKTEFARMVRTDHTMLPPTPAATLAYKSPNACNLCHPEKDAAWADALVRAWRTRDYQKPLLERAALVDAARREEWQNLPGMLAYIDGDGGNEVFKASLIQLLVRCDDSRKGPALIKALKDPSPLVRANAAAGLGEVPSLDAEVATLAALRDPVRLVRVRAAEALAGIPSGELREEDRKALAAAVVELEAAQRARPDDWSGHYNRGNFLAARGDWDAALAAFAVSSRLEPRAVQPYINASLVYDAKGDKVKAESSLRAALEREPKSTAALFNLGLLLAETGKPDEAGKSLRAAYDADPKFAPAAYNLCILTAEKQPQESLDWCRKAAELAPRESRYASTLAILQRKVGDAAGAEKTLLGILGQNAANPDAILLLGEIYQADGRKAAALALYRTALQNKDLPNSARPAISMRLEALE